MGNFTSLEIGLSGLRAFTTARNTIASNIANINDKSYKRREVVLEPNVIGINSLSGVNVSNIRRVVNYFAEKDLRTSTADYEKNDFVYSIYSQLDERLNVLSSNSIYQSFVDFSNSLEDLSQKPDDLTLRNIVITQGKNLCSQINSTINNNNTTIERIFQSAEESVDYVNQTLKQIADLNVEIQRIESLGEDANTLRDKRDGTIEDLSSYMNFDLIENQNGYQLSIDGKTVVFGNEYKEIKLDISSNPDKNISYSIPEYNTKANIFTGKLYGYQSSVEIVEDVSNKINKLIESLTSTSNPSINYIHRNGYDLNGNLSGNDFFVLDSVGNINVNDLLSENPDMIAASKTPNESNADNIFEFTNFLKSEALDGVSYFDYISNLSSELGFKTQNANKELDNSKDIKQLSENRRDEVSGVSEDEEMIKLLEIQKSYSTMAKFISTANDMFDDLLGILG
jgi:flagellar hook-associated protein 1 FlgK